MSEPVPAASFDEWALVELMGHQRIIGHVTEQQIGGAAMLRVDVPGEDGATKFTRYYSHSAVYAISPISKEMAVRAAMQVNATPIKQYELELPPARPTPPPRTAYYPEDEDESPI